MTKPTFQRLMKQARASLSYRAETQILNVTEAFASRMAQLGWNRTTLARKMKVSKPYVTKLFYGQNLTIETMVKVAWVLDLDLNITTSPKGRNP